MKFCFYGNISSALKGQTPGGGELQLALLAKALALKGHKVVVIDPFSDESFVSKEGVQLINIPTWNKGIRGIRLFKYRIPALRKIFIEQNADYYYVRMRSYMHLIPYRACKKIKSKFIIATACDLDVLSFWKKFKYEYGPNFNLFKFLTLSLPNDLVFNYLLKKADCVILQHLDQNISSKFGKGKIGVFNNIFDFRNLPNIKNPEQSYFIHVGSLTALKGVNDTYKLIKNINKKSVIVIVGQPKDRRSKKIYKALKQNENVILKGQLDHYETIKLIANAKALINTSNYEGFPNVFLEAWATGVPVISLKVNPGNVINKYNLGICCQGNLQTMKTSIELNKTANIKKEDLIKYVTQFHDFNTAADRFLNFIN